MQKREETHDESESEDSETRNLRSACLEARNTLDKQVQLIQGEDDKAIKLFRVNVLTLGVLASGFSITIQANTIPAVDFFNLHIVLGVTLLVISSLIASMAYTSSKPNLGIDPRAVRNADAMTRFDFLERLSDEYAHWIQINSDVHRFNAYALTWAMSFAISGILFFAGGFSVGLLQIRGAPLSYVMFIVESVLAVLVVSLLFRSDQIFRDTMYDSG